MPMAFFFLASALMFFFSEVERKMGIERGERGRLTKTNEEKAMKQNVVSILVDAYQRRRGGSMAELLNFMEKCRTCRVRYRCLVVSPFESGK